MSVCEEFKSWVEVGNWMYIDNKADALVIWQAAYAAGMEGGAKVCDDIAEARPFVTTARDCATAIRARKEG